MAVTVDGDDADGRRHPGPLTPRQQDVFDLLATGLTNEEIAQQLGIAQNSVKSHVAEILQRLGAENRHDAVSLRLRTESNARLAGLAPVVFLRKLPFAWLGKAAAGGALTTAAAGIALLAWGVMSTSTNPVSTTGCRVERTVGDAASCAPSVVQAADGADAITAISAGIYHSCAVKGGGVWCWGGYLTNGVAAISLVPVAVPGLESGVSAISSGVFSCALKGGAVWCWGSDPEGGDRITRPVVVAALASGVSAVSAVSGNVCALKSGGVLCWDGRPSTGLGAAVGVPGLESGVSAISGTCALKDGRVWCWGTPGITALVPWLTSGVSATQGSCAIKEGGVWCWDTPGVTGPVLVPGLGSGVSAISASTISAPAHSCAVKDGGVWCWGNNAAGQLGNNSTTDSNVPVAVSELTSGVSAISAGDDQTCALKHDDVWCWGQNSSGQLGNNSTTASSVPVRVLFAPPNSGDIAAAPDAKPHDTKTSTDSGRHRTAYVLGGTAAAALAIVVAGGWAMRRRRGS
jgi:DNA-binding CsgD family transcriptional regulator